MITVRDSIRQGHNQQTKRHYFVFVVDTIEKNVEIQEVLRHIRHDIMPQVLEGYEYDYCSYSNRYKGWLVQVSTFMDADRVEF